MTGSSEWPRGRKAGTMSWRSAGRDDLPVRLQSPIQRGHPTAGLPSFDGFANNQRPKWGAFHWGRSTGLTV